ncbi:MAG: Rieske (2Fe-2S) protein [Planctomycetota bacterium]
MTTEVRVARLSELARDMGTVVNAGGKELALFHVGGACYAIANECTHTGGPLAEGNLNGDEIECPWHAACFNIKTGKASGPPAKTDVKTYPVVVRGDEVFVQFE